MKECTEAQAQLGRRHSPGFPLPPFQPERLGSRSNSNCETLPEEAVEGASEGHLGPMGPRDVLLQVRRSSTCPASHFCFCKTKYAVLAHLTLARLLRVSTGSARKEHRLPGMQCWPAVLWRCEQLASLPFGSPRPASLSVPRYCFKLLERMWCCGGALLYCCDKIQVAAHALTYIILQGYLPREYECLDSKYGTEAELRACIKALHAHGIKALADIVLNHRCAGKQVGRLVKCS